MRWLAIALCLALSPASAGAATVSAAGTRSLQALGFPPMPVTLYLGTVQFDAAPGESNHVTTTLASDGRTVLVRDGGAALTAGSGCTALTASAAACDTLAGTDGAGPVSDLTETINLGDGDDSLHASLPFRDPRALALGTIDVDAGDGNDVVDAAAQISRVSGGSGDDDLTGESVSGGDGDDTLRGFAPSDVGSPSGGLLVGATLDGGAGDDQVIGTPYADSLTGGPGHDRITGGRGRDTVNYSGAASVVVDLDDRRPDGPEGDKDTLSGIEDVIGSDGDDVLIGDGGPNRLDGQGGNDTLRGGGGDDRLAGGEGADKLVGGEGDDHLEDDGQRGSDRLEGGSGDDHLSSGGAGDRLYGGTGDDTLSADRGSVIFAGPGDDRVADFSPIRRVVCGSGRDAAASQGARRLLPLDCERVGARLPNGEEVVLSAHVIAANRHTLEVPTPASCPYPHSHVACRRYAVRLFDAKREIGAATAGFRTHAWIDVQVRVIPDRVRLRLTITKAQGPRYRSTVPLRVVRR